jgi:hypothetical protein
MIKKEKTKTSHFSITMDIYYGSPVVIDGRRRAVGEFKEGFSTAGKIIHPLTMEVAVTLDQVKVVVNYYWALHPGDLKSVTIKEDGNPVAFNHNYKAEIVNWTLIRSKN